MESDIIRIAHWEFPRETGDPNVRVSKTGHKLSVLNMDFPVEGTGNIEDLEAVKISAS
jgi:hypothetical protein